jgi:hypothetical protein
MDLIRMIDLEIKLGQWLRNRAEALMPGLSWRAIRGLSISPCQASA